MNILRATYGWKTIHTYECYSEVLGAAQLEAVLYEEGRNNLGFLKDELYALHRILSDTRKI